MKFLEFLAPHQSRPYWNAKTGTKGGTVRGFASRKKPQALAWGGFT